MAVSACLRPKLDVLHSMALLVARNQADERLLHDPCLGDAVGVDAKET